MTSKYNIAGYCSVLMDHETNFINSIISQMAAIEEYVDQKFPGCALSLFVVGADNESKFQKFEPLHKLRQGLINNQYNILIVKDFSVFSRLNTRGLIELEELRDLGVRIISIDDNIDFPTVDDWLKIQMQLLVSSVPVVDVS